jgi:hypothetical protein
MIPKSGDWFSDKIMRRQKARFYGPDIRLPPGSGTAGDQTFDLFDADLRHIEPRRFRRFLVVQQVGWRASCMPDATADYILYSALANTG